MVSEEPYVRTLHSGPLVLPTGVGITNLQREIVRDQYNEDVQIFKEVIDVEKALIKQLVQAVPDLYLSPSGKHTQILLRCHLLVF